MVISRWIVKVEIEGRPVRYVAIGTGCTDDVQYAHLYTTKKLADKSAASERKSLQGWSSATKLRALVEVIEVTADVSAAL